MLPEEQLYKILRDKQAGLFSAATQLGNLGGSNFKYSEDPFTSIVGEDVNNLIRDQFEDTFSSSIFKGKNRLTPATGARMMVMLNRMDPRGVRLLKGLVSEDTKGLQWLKSINDSRIGVGGYTKDQAKKDWETLLPHLYTLRRAAASDDDRLFQHIAQTYVRGKLSDPIDKIRTSLSSDKTPGILKYLLGNVKNELTTANPKLYPAGDNVSAYDVYRGPGSDYYNYSGGRSDDSTFSGTTDKENNGESFLSYLQNGVGNVLGGLKEKLGPAADYMLPALLLGALGGGINKARGGSFLAPMLLMLLLGGMYGYGRSKGMLGSPDNAINKTIDTFANKAKEYGSKAKEYGEKAKAFSAAGLAKAKEIGSAGYDQLQKATKTVMDALPTSKKAASYNQKFANYRNATIIDIIK